MEATKLAPNTVLQDRYRILSLLKQGGMGRVYLAEDRRFRSRVAMKEACFAEGRLRQAFAREAGLLHRLRHQALPHVMDQFTEGEGQYLVMQYFPGKDLEELLAERTRETGGAFAVEQVLRWADQLLDALEYLHGRKSPIVHRDIKPQNLKLTERGDVILLDFGLAKGEAIETSKAGESLPGFTHHYAPLEQVRGMGTDPRSDLYALAATIHQLITGQLPPDALTRATATLERRPDPLRPANELNDQVPGAVAAVLMRAMAQLPDDRPATATEMRQALQAPSRENAPGGNDRVISVERSRTEIAAGSEELEIVTVGAAFAPVLAPTEVERIMELPSAPRPNDRSTVATLAWFLLDAARTWRVASGLLLLTAAVSVSWVSWGNWRLTRLPGSDAAVAHLGSSTQMPFHEVMRYYLQVESDVRKAERTAGSEPVVNGQWLKFHFTPSRDGYLYLVGPGERAAKTMFLTSQPNPAWRVKSNLLAAGTDYSFPPGRDRWIEVAPGASFRTYTIIFTPEPLARPGFLAGAAGRNLTAAEEEELIGLQRRFGRHVRIETRGDQSIVVIPAEQATGAPFLFEISLRPWTDQEGGKR